MKGIPKNITITLILIVIISILFSVNVIGRISNINNPENSSLGNTKVSIIILICFLEGIIILISGIMLIRIKKNIETKEVATTDQLTKLNNRHFFMGKIKEEIDRSKRFKHPLSLIMFDIDFFKKYNDTHGHNKGDDLLKKVSHIIKTSIREVDVAARWGGEEFLILLPETNGRESYVVAERIRAVIEEKTDVTVSIGLSYYKYYYPTIHEMIEKTDQLLYKAKKTGKNKICYK